MQRVRDSLEPGTLIDGYRIIRTIGTGGFSLVYLAEEEETGDEVVIKEFMPKRLARRAADNRLLPLDVRHAEGLARGRKLFFQEATAMAALRHPHIVQVRGLFLANDTAYLVMQHERGRNLGQFVQERGGGISTTLLLRIFIPLLDALALIHSRSMLHLDIKPANIHLRNGHDPLLLDLGAVVLMSSGRGLGSQVITAGYSPPEQHRRDGEIGPWTDVYAVGATMRCCLEGKAPPPAPQRCQKDSLLPAVNRFRSRYPAYLLEIIDWAMRLDATQRPRDAGEMLEVLQQRQETLPASALRELLPQRAPGEPPTSI